jgi:hypothetical protein
MMPAMNPVRALIRPEPRWTHWDPSERGPQRHRASSDARLPQLTLQCLHGQY